MPTYEYRCPDGHDFEHFFRKISDAQAEFACPVCGAIAERRMSAGAGLVFKGSGFYLTDYGRNAHRTSGPESSGSEAKGESKGESKGEPKADSKSESSGDAKSSSKSDGAKSESGSSATPKAESSNSTAKAEPAKTPKSTESKPSSGKTKGGTSE
jgi:putative FmdB family regulatory protein